MLVSVGVAALCRLETEINSARNKRSLASKTEINEYYSSRSVIIRALFFLIVNNSIYVQNFNFLAQNLSNFSFSGQNCPNYN